MTASLEPVKDPATTLEPDRPAAPRMTGIGPTQPARTGRRSVLPIPKALRRVRGSADALPIGLSVLGLLVLLSLITMVWTPFPPKATGTGLISAAPDAKHWFGTDAVGSDVFSRTSSTRSPSWRWPW